MNICLLSPEYLSPQTQGGIGTYTHNLARGLAGLGHRVTVITTAERALAGVGEVLPDRSPPVELTEDGVTIHRLAVTRRLRLPFGNRYLGLTLESVPFMKAVRRKVQELSARQPFDVVESPEWMAPGLLLSLSQGTPLVVRLHTHIRLVRRLNDLPENLDVRLLSWLEGALIRRASLVLANSESLAAECARDHGLLPGTIQVLPLGVDCERFMPPEESGAGSDSGQRLRKRLGLASDTPIVFYAGRLERRKGVDVLIEAFGELSRRHPRAVLVMAGFPTRIGRDGGRSYLEVLQERAIALGVADRLHFLGHVPYDELPAIYGSCDLFVAPSRFEPFGMIYLEAMACGRPVVACRTGGVPEIVVHGETGLLVEPGDAGALCAAMDQVLADPAYRRQLGKAGRRHMLARFSNRVIAERTVNVYRGAIRNFHEQVSVALGVHHAP